jgi:hypothetical protein
MVRRTLAVSAALLVLAACETETPTTASPVPVPNPAFAMSENAAFVIKDDGGCGMPGSDADGNIIFGGIGLQTTKVENNNKVMMTCKAEGLTNLSGQAQHFEGFGCGLPFPSGGGASTTDTHATVTPGGIGTMTCTVTLD